MGVYGKIRLNNLFSINGEDMLGAFINGKCVGLCNNTYNTSNNLWYAYLTFYSNDLTNNNVEFRIWQASTGKSFSATPASVINFANNAILGTPAVPVIFDGSPLLYRDMAVNENWNWVSFNQLIPNNTPVGTTMINGIWTNNDLIKNDLSGFSNYTTSGWVGSLNFGKCHFNPSPAGLSIVLLLRFALLTNFLLFLYPLNSTTSHNNPQTLRNNGTEKCHEYEPSARRCDGRQSRSPKQRWRLAVLRDSYRFGLRH